ncbi:protein encoded in hypervariable junctions of pilus gene clusters [Aequorivita sublithincola DSM 14238]|uniref:Protein encoded in hypervariable junctions of pilus gene clusters n=1 Tax=Aequorivita sublithincola (strain DSM 14238 / LMG 21431 / ACAM 643 / 9-3) TaxID=746697 RepID=I3YTX9_AEQSU|nr:type II toxin-antitoxin system HicB family antitoxin [Aequorivita sublithincola]AFL80447.1 protein encoded in hypervariable junctions of pilus gene clusters [Aequorivita sublithincola DSM 14238]
MTNYLKHKGYIRTVEYSAEDKCLYGKVIGINDLVNYEAQSVEDLTNSFNEAVEDYLKTCKQLGKEPDKYFKGVFNVRAGSTRHRKLAIIADKKKMKLNELVNVAFDYLIKNEDEVLHEND